MNLEFYNITVGLYQMPAKANDPPKNRKRDNYKQYKCCLREGSDMSLHNMHIEDHFKLADEHLAIPIAKIINIY